MPVAIECLRLRISTRGGPQLDDEATSKVLRELFDDGAQQLNSLQGSARSSGHDQKRGLTGN
jgi:hypothetical protein